MEPIRVMVVDDHEVVRLGLGTAIEAEADMRLVGQAPDAETALRDAAVLKPDVVLMDVRLPKMNGIEACRALKDIVPGARVIMLTSLSDEDPVLAAVMAGASGYLVKTTGRDDLISAIRRVAKGESQLDPVVTARILERLRAAASPGAAEGAGQISAREKEVLELVTKGLTNKEIAAQLNISEHTVNRHVSNIYSKTGTSNRANATAYAMRKGISR